MTENEGTYAALMELQESKSERPVETRIKEQLDRHHSQDDAFAELATTPYQGQHYRFTKNELRWLKQKAYSLSDRLDEKVTQNLILRIALAHLRHLVEKDSRDNPLLDALRKIRR